MTSIVAFVLNDARFDSRVVRELSTFAAAGHRVLLVARTTDPYAAGPEELELEGLPVVRVPLATGWRRWLMLARRPRHLPAAAAASLRRRPISTAAGIAVALVVAVPLLVVSPIVLLAVAAGRLVPPLTAVWRGLAPLIAWRVSVLPWAGLAAATSGRLRPDASIFWAHDLRALPAAIAARDAARRGAVVYDAHEIFSEAGEHALRPGWSKRRLVALERGLARRIDALVTVNEALAAHLRSGLGVRRVVVARNCPPRWEPTGASPLRPAAGVPEDVPLILYHGGLAAGRGLEVLRAAIDRPGLERAHLVFLGFGPLRTRVAEMTRTSGGRVHLLDPVPPGELLAWVAGADVVAAPIQSTTLNHRLSSPNKVFEGIAAGVPVVGADLPGIREVLLADPTSPLGALVDPDDPEAVAAAIHEIVDRAPDEAAGLRARCLAAAHNRWNWETESAGLVELVAELGRAAAPAAAGTRPAAAGTRPAAAAAGPRLGAADPTPTSAPVPQRVCYVLPTSGEFDNRTRRFGSSLAGRGHVVTVVARPAAGLPPREAWGPGISIVRPASVAAVAAGTSPADRSPEGSAAGGALRRLLRPIREARRILGVAAAVRRQSRAVDDLDLAPDIVHAMGFLALPVARRLARRTRARLVYDARDLYVESNNIARLPGVARAAFAWLEGRWARAADRVVTVNEACADYLERRYRLRRPVVVMNGQEPWPQPPEPPDVLRRRLGLAPDRRIVLYHGGLMPDRGLDQLVAAAADPAFGGAELVIMGSGVMESRLRDTAGASPAGDRIHLLPPVPPDELLEAVASADVGVMPNQPRTLNERLSTPNKLFECLAAGTPVVSSDFPERRRIIVDDPDGPLGRVCDPADPSSIARAVGELLALDSAAFADLRARCRRASEERYGWPPQLARAIEAYGELTRRPW